MKNAGKSLALAATGVTKEFIESFETRLKAVSAVEVAYQTIKRTRLAKPGIADMHLARQSTQTRQIASKAT